MIGRTNVGGGGRNFTATLQITTDPNAVITAVNLAGDTVSGTANASGSLTLNVSQPGTYTVTETDGGSETIVVADDGYTYVVEVYAFDGTLIRNGLLVVAFESLGLNAGESGPTASPTTVDTENAILIEQPDTNSGIYRTEDFIDISNYSSLAVRAKRNSNLTTYIYAYGSDGSSGSLVNLTASLETTTISLSNLSRSVNWKFGVNLANGNSVSIVNLKLE